MRRIIYIILLFFIFSMPVYAQNSGYIEGEDEYNNIVSKIISGNFEMEPAEIIKEFWEMLMSEILKSKALIINIMVIAAVSGVLNVLESSFSEGASGEIAFFACFTLISVAVTGLISESIGYGAEVVGRLSGFITKICPVITILMVSSGAAVSASSFYPVLSASVYVVSLLIDKFIIPLVYLGAILGIINNVSKRVQLGQLNNLIKSFSKWILTGILTIFTGINAIYGFSVPVLDAVTLKALKFTVGSFVPVVGGIVADTVETVLGGAKLMKNAVGTAGIIMVVMICIIPIIKLAVIIMMLKFTAACVEPLTDKRISGMISDVSGPVTTVFSMVIASAMLFIISIAIIMGAT